MLESSTLLSRRNLPRRCQTTPDRRTRHIDSLGCCLRLVRPAHVDGGEQIDVSVSDDRVSGRGRGRGRGSPLDAGRARTVDVVDDVRVDVASAPLALEDGEPGPGEREEGTDADSSTHSYPAPARQLKASWLTSPESVFSYTRRCSWADRTNLGSKRDRSQQWRRPPPESQSAQAP
jgi:hypothetical protein